MHTFFGQTLCIFSTFRKSYLSEYQPIRIFMVTRNKLYLYFLCFMYVTSKPLINSVERMSGDCYFTLFFCCLEYYVNTIRNYMRRTPGGVGWYT